MEIERINENTVKFNLSYGDIEARGFSKEDVWYNRDKSEELFWDMMDELGDDTEFEVEGPLWIQVNAMNEGIEVIVTRAHLPKNAESSQFPFGIEDPEELFDPIFDAITESEEESEEELQVTDRLFVFNEFDQIIPLASKMISLEDEFDSQLYAFEDRYYLNLRFDYSLIEKKRAKDIASMVTEYGAVSKMSIHRIDEYGKEVMGSDVFEQVNKYFS
ncbi:adaptor protein MecA [Sporosarcina sp. P12(2017)]|uniref:adaptor protein MecA n=1 Tax=unclassified Sporosarcina TaxID=2647733 RepID=UPI000C167785|nr:MULTISPECIES: adaptor protein MecA [unclassified Sporosarcina]PIC56198.1 adaptor protein MecA [Sporosarcina sp. P10]PIC60088.1 adaptor protein MecA [Sporosarcina sp. P12(2017)]